MKKNSKPSTGSNNKGNCSHRMRGMLDRQECTTSSTLIKTQSGSKYGIK